MKFLFTYLFLFSALVSFAQLQAYAKKGELQIGEQTELVYEFQLADKNAAVNFQPFSKIIPCNKRNGTSYINTGEAAELEIIGEFRDTVIKTKLGIFWKGSYQITAWDTGQFLIPPTTIIVDDSTYDFYPVLLKITAPTPVEGKEIYDIKESYLDVDFDVLSLLKSYWWVLLILLLLLVFLYLLRRRKKLQARKPEKRLSLKEKTLKALAGLEQARMWEKDMLKEHYIELSFIFRSYLSARYHLNFLEKTSLESALLLKNFDLNKDTITTIRIILDYADMVKFAKAHPQEHEILKNLMQVQQIVTETSPFDAEHVD